ncbi:hypothetical protein [Rhodoferax sp.]|uniref:hypothetical protein n=1 Tax=Rhodoferax sp. TaxID=50421 RepID=UPI0035251731
MALLVWVMARPKGGVGVGAGQAGQLEQTFHHFLNLAFVPTFAVDALAAYRQAVYDARS